MATKPVAVKYDPEYPPLKENDGWAMAGIMKALQHLNKVVSHSAWVLSDEHFQMFQNARHGLEKVRETYLERIRLAADVKMGERKIH
jgi:hypothetical protein